MPNVDAVWNSLAEAGYRLTGPRRLVLEEVISRDAPFTSSELWDTVRSRHPGVGRATVFRTLDLLCQLGAVQRIHQDASGGRCHAYLACGDEHHHHLICSGCGTVLDFQEDAALDALVREVERRTAFRVEAHRLEFVGRCPSCREGSQA